MGNTDNLSIQLYTLRSLGELDRILDTVKQAGYKHVETVGSQLDDAENVRAPSSTAAASRYPPATYAWRRCGSARTSWYRPAAPWASTSSSCLPCRQNSGRATRRSGARWGANSARSPSACAARGIAFGYHNHH
jgi:hypothetical protein